MNFRLKQLLQDLKKLNGSNQFGVKTNNLVLSHQREIGIVKNGHQFKAKILEDCEDAINYLIRFLKQNEVSIKNGGQNKISQLYHQLSRDEKKTFNKHIKTILSEKCKDNAEFYLKGLYDVIKQYNMLDDMENGPDMFLRILYRLILRVNLI